MTAPIPEYYDLNLPPLDSISSWISDDDAARITASPTENTEKNSTLRAEWRRKLGSLRLSSRKRREYESFGDCLERRLQAKTSRSPHNNISRVVNYGPLWVVAKKAAKERSGGICEYCHKAPSKAVHHILPVRLFSSVNDAHFLENLLDICTKCHGQLHQNINRDFPRISESIYWKPLSIRLGINPSVMSEFLR